MARDKTYSDLLDDIKETKDKAIIEKSLDEISSKYGIGAANKAIGTCGLEKLGIKPRV